MKKLFLSLLAAGILLTACNSNKTGASAVSTAAASAANVVVMKFEKETHDFGKIKAGDLVTYDFKFTNSGKAPLIINDAVATCGCNKPKYSKTLIKPGESSAIHVTFNSAGNVGMQDKQITIIANTNPVHSRVHVIGEVT